MKKQRTAESPAERWTRPGDYVEALARKRTARRRRAAKGRTEPEVPRLLLSTLPFLVTTHSPVDMIRDTVFLACVSAIYFWRAKTEEMHLLRQDAKYREYHAWMAEHGLITAPLTRLLGRARPRRVVVQPAE